MEKKLKYRRPDIRITKVYWEHDFLAGSVVLSTDGEGTGTNPTFNGQGGSPNQAASRNENEIWE